MFIFPRPRPGDGRSCLLFTYRDEKRATKNYHHVIDRLKKNPLPFVSSVKLGKCKQERIDDFDVIEPYWLIIIIPAVNLVYLDDWICKKENNVETDDIYTGHARLMEFEKYASVIEETEFKDGKVVVKKRMTIEWEDERGEK